MPFALFKIDSLAGEIILAMGRKVIIGGGDTMSHGEKSHHGGGDTMSHGKKSHHRRRGQ